MSSQKSLTRISEVITHPLSLASLLILLLNDHVLRKHIPSILTGKAGDFAWLFFATLTGAWLISVIVRDRNQKIQRLVPLIGFFMPAIIFTLGKTHQGFHILINNVFEQVIGLQSMLRLDPTDLVALMSLLPAWIIWMNAPRSRPRTGKAPWLIICLFGILTIANSAAADYGIEELIIDKDRILAASTHYCYYSTDGGLTWNATERAQCESTPMSHDSLVADPANSDRVWRISQAGSIDISHDGGLTWEVDYEPSQISQAQGIYFRRSRHNSVTIGQSPFDVLYDPPTGNVIVAMGHRGVLVRQETSRWDWIGVGLYKSETVSTFGMVSSLLVGELFLALSAGLLMFSALSLKARLDRTSRVIVILGSLLWLITLIVFPPAIAISSSYTAFIPISMVGLITLSAVMLIPFAVIRLYSLSPQALWLTTGISLVFTLLFPIPYVLWAMDLLTSYWIATVLALGLTVSVLWFSLFSRRTSTLDMS